MVVAQLAVPAAAALGIVFAVWFAAGALRRRSVEAALAERAAAVRSLADAYLLRLIAVTAPLALVAIVAAAIVVGIYRDDWEAAGIASVSVALGVIAAIVVAQAGLAIATHANVRAADAAATSLRQALALTLWTGLAPALVAAALAVAAVAGLYGAVTNLLDQPVGDAPYLVAGVALGSAIVALVARSLASTTAAGPEDAVAQTRGLAQHGAGAALDALAAFSAVAVAGLALGTIVQRVDGEAGWLLVPVTVQAFALLATVLAGISLPLWARTFRNAGRAVGLGFAVQALLGAGGIVVAAFALAEDGAGWFALAGVSGLLASAAAFAAVRSGAGSGGSFATRSIIVAGLLGVAAVLAVLCGTAAGLEGVDDRGAALVALGIAGAGAMVPLPYISGLGWFGATAASAVSLVGADESPPPASTPAGAEAPERLDVTPFATVAERASRPVLAQLPVLSALAAALLLAALLLGLRGELGHLAADDLPRYAEALSEAGAIGSGPELEAAFGADLAAYRNDLTDRGVPDGPLGQLLLASDEEVIAVAGRLVADGALDEAALRGLGAGPRPLGALPPLDLMSPPGALGVLLGALALAGAGIVWRRAAAAGSASFLVLALPFAASAAWRGLAPGEVGWLLAAGFATGAVVAGLVLVLRGREDDRSWSGTAAALTVVSSLVVLLPGLLATIP